MDNVFPFGLPWPTAFYLVLYVGTFALHQAFMHYVLAGSVYVAWVTLRSLRGDGRLDDPLTSTLRDWMPFMLSAAITAGVAPLLFVQIVYPQHFYTANLLLSWRWMVVIPVLIMAFYLLYLTKSALFARWPYVARSGIVVFVAACFLFVGFCWTANHLLSSNAAAWPQIYATGNLQLSPSVVLLRMLMWTGGACGSMAVIVAWQLVARRQELGPEIVALEMRRLAAFALAGLTVASLAAVAFMSQASAAVRATTLGAFALPYVLLAVAGILAQVACWVLQWRGGYRWSLLVGATVGWLLALGGTAVAREAVRLAAVDLPALYARHADAGEIGGLGVFLLFLVVNGAAIAWCVMLVRRGLRAAKNG